MDDFSLLSTSPNGKHKFSFKISFVEAPDVVNNNTKLTFSLIMNYVSGNGTAWADQSRLKYKVIINGESFEGKIPDYYNTAYDPEDIPNSYTKKELVIISNRSLVNKIQHNTDGTKSISVSLQIINNDDIEFVPGSSSNTASMKLTTIARASSFTIKSTSLEVEGAVGITITRNSSSFTHKIIWEAVLNNTPTPIVEKNLNKTLPTSLTVPTEFYGYFKDKKIKEVSVNIKCATYYGNSLVGNAVKRTAKVKMSSEKCTPIIENIELDSSKINILGSYNEGMVIEGKEGQNPTVVITYTIPSAAYSKEFGTSPFTKTQQISSPDEKIKITDLTGKFASTETTLNDISNDSKYYFYKPIQGELVNIKKEYETQTTTNADGTSTTTYPITKLECDVNISNFIPYLMQKEPEEIKNKLSYRYYLGIQENPEDNYSEVIELDGEISSFLISKDSNVFITLNSLIEPFYIFVKFWDSKISENNAITLTKKIIIQPLFDWNEEDFKFSVPVEINIPQANNKGWYSPSTTLGGALNLNNGDIIKANSIYFSDKSDSAGEGLCFPNGNVTTNTDGSKRLHYDCFKAYNGKIYFIPDHPTNTNKYEVPLCYRKGEKVTISELSNFSGYIYQGNVRFFIPLTKPVATDVTNINLKSGWLALFNHQGRMTIPSSQTNYFDVVNSTHCLAINTSLQPHGCHINIKINSVNFNAALYTPVSVVVHAGHPLQFEFI